MTFYPIYSTPLLTLSPMVMILYGLHVSYEVDCEHHKIILFYCFVAFIFYAQVLLQAVYFSPLLACVHAPFKFLGYSLGLLYSSYL